TLDSRFLVDCGLFQGPKKLRERNWRALPVDPSTLDAVVLTHAHLDHTGYLPVLMKGGFRGPVYCTSGTRALCGILLPDSGHLQEEDARYANKKGYSRHRPALPLYTQEEAEAALGSFRAVPFDEHVDLGSKTSLTFSPVGHILGAAAARFTASGKSLVFSGDVGRFSDPIMRPPRTLGEVDGLVVESTYGNRLHAEQDPADALGEVVGRTVARGGIVLIPSFAVGRAQSLLFLLSRLRESGRLPAELPVFLNSPMAVNATRIFCAHPDEHRLSESECADMCNVATYVNSVEDSKELNTRREPAIIISASGMLTGGRVLHHLKAFGGDERNTILFVGYQGVGTRGHALLDGTTHLKIHGQLVEIKAEVAQISGLSAHADYAELCKWLQPLPAAPERVFITHGEPDASAALKGHLEQALAWNAEVPAYRDKIELFGERG
ncbi:MAG TPA: MBL fold metallo-hydrolase, partial [Gammaproteobacteria bacterium]|nr:MBL fold metallo-hydrolase [Gammaproteobacteria bacterium]